MAGTNNGQPDSAMLALIREHSAARASRLGGLGCARGPHCRQRPCRALGSAARCEHDRRSRAAAPAPRARPMVGGDRGLGPPRHRRGTRRERHLHRGGTRIPPTVAVADAEDTGTAAWLQTLDAAGGVTVAPALNRDSLLSEVVSQ